MIPAMKTRPVSIIIIENHPMMREALVTALSEEPDLQVVGTTGNGRQGIELYRTLKPDVVLMDILMPGLNGLQTSTKILALDPDAKILVVSSLEGQEDIANAFQIGVRGYFPKTAPRHTLLAAIHQVAAGKLYLPPGVASQPFKQFVNFSQLQ